MKKRDEVKIKRKNRRKRRKAALLVFLSLVAAGLLFGLSITVFFPVKHLQVTGSNYYTEEQIKEATEIHEKDNLLLISEEKVLHLLQLKLPFVDNAKLTRKFPDTLKITITDASEVYCYKINDVFYSADKKGRILKEYTEKPQELLYVEANVKLSADDIRCIVFEDESAQKVISAISQNFDKFPAHADYIDLTDIYSVVMGFEDRFTAQFGDVAYIEEKIPFLIEMMETKNEDDSGTFRFDMWTPENPKGSYFKNTK